MMRHDCQHPISTARLLLRPPRPSDLDTVIRLFSRPELVAHRPDPTPDTPAASKARLDKDMRHWQEHGYGRWAIEAEGNTIGFGGPTYSEAFDAINLSYHLSPEAWGKGYASELVTAAIALALGKLEAEQIIGLARVANPASCRVLEKAGLRFQREVELHGAPTRLYTLPQADQL